MPLRADDRADRMLARDPSLQTGNSTIGRVGLRRLRAAGRSAPRGSRHRRISAGGRSDHEDRNVSIRPQTIEQPPTTSTNGSNFGIGVGKGSFSGGRGGGVGVGTGVGVSIPMGSDTRVAGNTVLYFPLDQVGQAPWRLTVRVAGVTLADIVLLPR